MDIDPRALPSPHALAYLASRIRTIADFPRPGIQFKDITTLVSDARALHIALDLLAEPFIGQDIHYTAAMEARGFIFGGALAARLNTGFVAVRKPGKLPGEVDEVGYSLEYGDNRLAMHRGSIEPGSKVLVVDDLLATGGTAAATAALVQKQGGVVAGFAFVIELDFLAGRDQIAAATTKETPVHALVHVME